ncbi:MAG: crossover junction endodeoxyribonuclease RuvC [Steroidobacteraceae bacterium]
MRKFRTSSWRSVDPVGLGAATAPARQRAPFTVLGLDPGSRRTGYGVLRVDARRTQYVTHGCIVPRADDLAQRLREIHDSLSEIARSIAPDEIAIERVFMSRNADSALKLGQARGAALCAVGPAPVFEYAPRAVKLAVVGTGAAAKGQVQHMVAALLGLRQAVGSDESDALAIALCHANTRAFERTCRA